ncbi:MAG: ATP synthase subunit C [Candidatus Thorarchaeota archaeon]
MKIYSLKTSLVLLVFSALVMFLSLSAFAALIVGAHAVSALSVTPDLGFVLLQTDSVLGIVGLALAAAITMGAAGVGAALGMASTSAAALGAITERPELFGKTVLYVVFIEAVAIYGFVIAFMLVGYIPSLIG